MYCPHALDKVIVKAASKECSALTHFLYANVAFPMGPVYFPVCQTFVYPVIKGVAMSLLPDGRIFFQIAQNRPQKMSFAETNWRR
jgi:hypothetical protein